MRARSILPLVASVAFVVGCAGGEEDAAITESELSNVVLQPQDLPDPFTQFDEGKLVRSDTPRGTGGWKARYKRPGSSSTSGALVVESRVDLFSSEASARADLRAVEQQLAAAGYEELRAPRLGDETNAVRLTQGGATGVVFFTVTWREENALAAIAVNGFRGKVTLAEAVALARKQQRRLARAAG